MLLGVREILRSKVRFGLLSGAVGLLIFLILFQQALLNGLITGFIGAVDNQRSPVLVFSDQARKNVEASFLSLEQAAAVAQVDGVGRSALIGESTYSVDAGGEVRDAVLFGYELGGLGEPLTLTDGRLPTTDFEVVASGADADKGFAIGDAVRILGQRGGEDLVVTVVGLGDDLRWSVAPTMFGSYATFEAAQRAVNPDAQLVLPSLVAVEPADGVSAAEMTDRIDAAVGGTEALTRQEAVDLNPGVRAVNQSFQIVLALAFVVVALVVGFFFLILTVQKARALTLLRAIGAPARYLVQNLLLQIAVVLGGGMLIGLGMVLLVRQAATSGDVPVSLQAGVVVPTLVLLAVLSLLGGLASIRRVLRLDPVTALRDGGAR